jgi:membrane protein
MMKRLLSMLVAAYNEWNANKAPRMAAALAYYAVFSIAPLLIIAIAVAGLAFGQSAAQDEVMAQIREMLGPGGADIVITMLRNTSTTSSGIIATLVGVAVLIWGSTQVFIELQDSLDTIFGVTPRPGQPIQGVVRARVFSFSMVLTIGFLLLISLILSAVLAALGKLAVGIVPYLQNLMQIANILISFGIVTLLFAAIYKVLPDISLQWRDVWFGALVTAGLFTIGKYLIGLYLGQTSVGSAYGAAGSLVILLLWVNFNAQILFFGAEIAKVNASHRHKLLPKTHAIKLSTAAQIKQGIVKPPESPPPPPG